MNGARADLAPSPFHAGEQAVQARVGVRERMDQRGARAIRDFMPDQHRSFFALLPFLPIALNGLDGWPAATILTGPPGFVASPDPRQLRVSALPDPADPVAPLIAAEAPIGVLGIDLATRRRNRANGRIAFVDRAGFAIAVDQSFGNCSQYIQAREIEATTPATAPGVPGFEQLGGIDGSARALIRRTDTFFVASSAGAGVDISHRGGRAGFIRVDGDMLTVPDFAGNRYFNTLGNFAVNPRAALLFPDFVTGELLHLAGAVETVWDGEEVSRFRGAERLWRLHVASGWRHHAALPMRWWLPGYAPSTEATGTW